MKPLCVRKKDADKIYSRLKKEYPEATTTLGHANALQLLVATILSAQCTDERVNKVTKELFRKYRSLEDYARAKPAVFEQDIRSTGFYRNKAKNIIGAARSIRDDFGGRVPDTMGELVTLPGVARKTANIVLTHAYDKNEGIAVDTHVKRLSGRLGFSCNTDPVKIEKDLMLLFFTKEWGQISNVLIEHGRAVCAARKPHCLDCPVKRLCPSAKMFMD